MKTIDAVEILNHRFGNASEIRKRIAQESVKLQVSELIYQARTDAELTQEQLAKLIKTEQSTIADLEDADYDGPPLEMLQKVSAALNKELRVNSKEAEDTTEIDATPQENQIGQLLQRKLDRWLEFGWQTFQSLELVLNPPHLQYASARSSSSNDLEDLLEEEFLAAERLANTDPNHSQASVRMAKELYELGRPVAVALSVSPVRDSESVNILLQLYALSNENLPSDFSIRLLDEQGQPEYFTDAPDEIIESRASGETKALYLPFQYPKGECFNIEVIREEIKVREQFVV